MSRKKKAEGGVDVTLPITPMLDMSFQLLSFFIMTFRSPQQEGQLQVDLPRSDGGSATDISSLTEPKEEYTIVVNGDLEIRALSIRGPAIPESDLKDIATLDARLKEVKQSKGGKTSEVSITIESDERLIYARLIEVMDRCKYHGFDSVNLKPYTTRGRN